MPDRHATVIRGDARALPLSDATVDAIVCDPPYELGFMGKGWDSTGVAYDVATWREAIRVLKPGGHLLAFGGSRTWHRLAVAIEDAGFELRDNIAWLYGSGFPKSLDVSKAIDRRRDWTALPLLQGRIREARAALGISQSEAARRCGLIAADDRLGGGGYMWFETGMRVPTAEQYVALKAALSLDDTCDRAFQEAEREITGKVTEWTNRTNYALTSRDGLRRDKPATDAARRWQGWGTALKPGFEPVVVARKPPVGSVAANVLAHGTGALNIDACRVTAEPGDVWNAGPGGSGIGVEGLPGYERGLGRVAPTQGRWPTNVVLSHQPLVDGDGEVVGDACADGCVEGCPVAELDTQSGPSTSPVKVTRGGRRQEAYGMGRQDDMPCYGDTGGASRFFPTFRYQAKAPTKERPKVTMPSEPALRLRVDLSDEQRAYVLAELSKAGVDTA